MSISKKLLVAQYKQADKIMLPVLWLLFIMGLGLAPWYDTWKMAVLVGGAFALVPTLLMYFSPGSRLTRVVVAAALMMFCALHIQQAMGVTELHFGIFVLLAVLLCYRDWLVIVVAAGVIALHHLTFNYFQQLGYGTICFTEPGFGRVLAHAGYVVAETLAYRLLPSGWRVMPVRPLNYAPWWVDSGMRLIKGLTSGLMPTLPRARPLRRCTLRFLRLRALSGRYDQEPCLSTRL